MADELTDFERRTLENGWIERDFTGIRLAVAQIVAARTAQLTMIASVNSGLHRDAEREVEELTARVADARAEVDELREALALVVADNTANLDQARSNERIMDQGLGVLQAQRDAARAGAWNEGYDARVGFCREGHRGDLPRNPYEPCKPPVSPDQKDGAV